MTTNKEELVLNYMPTSKDDRRKFIIRCSDELIADPEKPDYIDKKKYFDDFYAMLDDVNSVKTFYEYLKSIPNMKDFNKLKLPKTEFHQQIKENIKDEYDMDSWVKTLLANEENTNDCYFLPNRTKARDLFNHYVDTTGNKKKINEREFICKFAKMKINGYHNDLKLGKKSKPNIGLDRDLMMEHLDMQD